jgi:hypothetical protein
MSNLSKKVQGQLLDIASKEILSDILIEIFLIQPKSSVDRFEYRAYGTIKGYKPEFDNKSYNLKLGESISGNVFISIDGIPDTTQTRFKIVLQDSVWSNLDWFQSL